MKDINLPVRAAFFNALNGQLSYDNSDVTVSDEQLKSGSFGNNYVLLSSQSSTHDAPQGTFDREATILIDIVTKTSDTVTKNIADEIAGQITGIIFPDPFTTSLTPPTDWQFLKVRVSDDRYMPVLLSGTSHIVRRLLTFSLRVVQN